MIVRASTIRHGYAKCPQNLSMEQQLDSAAGMPKVGKCKFFWHSATVPSYM